MLLTRCALAALAVLFGAAVPNPAPAAVTPALEARLRHVFDRIDEDHDGSLDAAELAHHFRGRKAKPAPPVFDAKGNWKLPPAAARTKDWLWMATMDSDGDGQISWDEYLAYSAK